MSICSQSSGTGSGGGGGSGRSGGGHANGNHHNNAAAGGPAGGAGGGVNENKSVDFLYYSDSDSEADEESDVGIANSLAYRVSVNFTDCLGRTLPNGTFSISVMSQSTCSEVQTPELPLY